MWETGKMEEVVCKKINLSPRGIPLELFIKLAVVAVVADVVVGVRLFSEPSYKLLRTKP